MLSRTALLATIFNTFATKHLNSNTARPPGHTHTIFFSPRIGSPEVGNPAPVCVLLRSGAAVHLACLLPPPRIAPPFVCSAAPCLLAFRPSSCLRPPVGSLVTCVRLACLLLARLVCYVRPHRGRPCVCAPFCFFRVRLRPPLACLRPARACVRACWLRPSCFLAFAALLEKAFQQNSHSCIFLL